MDRLTRGFIPLRRCVTGQGRSACRIQCAPGLGPRDASRAAPHVERCVFAECLQRPLPCQEHSASRSRDHPCRTWARFQIPIQIPTPRYNAPICLISDHSDHLDRDTSWTLDNLPLFNLSGFRDPQSLRWHGNNTTRGNSWRAQTHTLTRFLGRFAFGIC